jgi:hypothetical protein
MVQPVNLTWRGLSQWLHEGGAGGEVLLVFENTENVLIHHKGAEVRVLRQATGCAENHVLHSLRESIIAEHPWWL